MTETRARAGCLVDRRRLVEPRRDVGEGDIEQLQPGDRVEDDAQGLGPDGGGDRRRAVGSFTVAPGSRGG